MAKSEFAERLASARRRAGFPSPREAAKEFGWNENTYKSRENGVRGIPDQSEVRTYARAFRVNFIWLLTGEGQVSPQRRGANIVGEVGANARPDAISFEDCEIGGAPLPPEDTLGTVAVRVRGDSMRNTAPDGWLIYFDDDDIRQPPTPDLFHQLCVVWLADGRVLLKYLHPGTGPGLFHLESTNAPTIFDVVVERATLVTALKPRGYRPNTDEAAA